MSMKKRVISAFVIILLIVPIIIKGGYLFRAVAYLLGIYSMKELIDVLSKKNNIPVLIKILSLIAIFVFEFLNINYANDYLIDFRSICLILLLLLVPLILYNDNKKYNLDTALMLCTFVFLIGSGYISITLLRENNVNLFIYILLIPIFTDTFAYIGGNLIGKHYLCPKISPKKTWEGFFTGIILTTFSMTLIYLSLFTYSNNLLLLILIILFLSICSSAGDLFFSLIKRENNVKDFSNIIPGHGGLLDRIDSILFVYIAYVLIMSFI